MSWRWDARSVWARVLAVAGVHVPLDPNEGWNAYHTAAAMSVGPLYPGAGSFLANNYPPLSFYVVGLFGGDHIIAGRIISLLAFAAVTASIFAAARTMGTSRRAASFGALWFAAGLLIFTDYVGIDDPQLLGHAIAMAGFLLLLRGNMAGAALAMAVALFVKHNLVAHAGGGADLARALRPAKRGPFRRMGIGRRASGTCRVPADLRRGSVRRIALAPTFLACIAGREHRGLDAFGAEPRSPRWRRFCSCAGTTAMWRSARSMRSRRSVVGACFSGGAGVDMNVWFDAVIALSIAAALAMDGFERPLHKALAAFAYAVPLLCGLTLAYDGEWLTHDFWLHPARDEAAMAAADIDFLKAHDGPVLCEMLSLCYWAGKPAEVDVFNLGQAFATRARSDETLVRLVEARRFRAVEFDSMDDFALGPRVKDAFARNYRVDHEDDNGVFLVPR